MKKSYVFIAACMLLAASCSGDSDSDQALAPGEVFATETDSSTFTDGNDLSLEAFSKSRNANSNEDDVADDETDDPITTRDGEPASPTTQLEDEEITTTTAESRTTTTARATTTTARATTTTQRRTTTTARATTTTARRTTTTARPATTTTRPTTTTTANPISRNGRPNVSSINARFSGSTITFGTRIACNTTNVYLVASYFVAGTPASSRRGATDVTLSCANGSVSWSGSFSGVPAGSYELEIFVRNTVNNLGLGRKPLSFSNNGTPVTCSSTRAPLCR